VLLLQRFPDDRLVAVEVPVEQRSDLIVLVGDMAIDRDHGVHHHSAHCCSSRFGDSGVDDQPTVDQADIWHMSVSTDHGPHVRVEFGEHLELLLQAGVDQHHLLVVTRRAVAEHHRTEPGDMQLHRMRQLGKQAHLIGAKLLGSPT
jgi:hypothetical protein